MREEAAVRDETHLPEMLEAGEEEGQEGPQSKKDALMENPAGRIADALRHAGLLNGGS